MYGAGKHTTGLTSDELSQRGGNKAHYACVVALGPSLRLHAGHTQLLLSLRAIVAPPLDCKRIIVHDRLGWLSCVSCRHFVPAAEAPDADARRVKFFLLQFRRKLFLLFSSPRPLRQNLGTDVCGGNIFAMPPNDAARSTAKAGRSERRCLFFLFFSKSLRDSARAPS